MRRRPGGPGGTAGGFTLVETMIAMGITITVMLANLFLFSTASRNLAEARALTDATNLASGKLAELRAQPIANIVPGTDTVPAGGHSYTRTWTVSPVDVDGDGTADLVGDLVKVRVEVAWTAAARPHRVSLATLTTGGGAP